MVKLSSTKNILNKENQILVSSIGDYKVEKMKDGYTQMFVNYLYAHYRTQESIGNMPHHFACNSLENTKA
jgi:hypothetical protein